MRMRGDGSDPHISNIEVSLDHVPPDRHRPLVESTGENVQRATQELSNILDLCEIGQKSGIGVSSVLALNPFCDICLFDIVLPTFC